MTKGRISRILKTTSYLFCAFLITNFFLIREAALGKIEVKITSSRNWDCSFVNDEADKHEIHSLKLEAIKILIKQLTATFRHCFPLLLHLAIIIAISAVCAALITMITTLFLFCQAL